MTTSRVQAPEGVAYIALNTGPCIIELQDQGSVRIIVGTSTPAVDSVAFHLISFPAGQFPYGGTETVYGQADKDGINPYIIVTPVL